MRLIVILLLMAVFFLSGIVYGTNQETKQTVEDSEASITEAEPEESLELDEETIAKSAVQPELDGDSSVILTQKTASALEAGVKGFFEIIMQVMYQTAQIFF
ncbi:hypothetical protein [Oceanobacillus massiliensis]|uniref:hypothetical protein n=1 Tax=Oceanobacillus massiliensis TaxID=1465765 RepID=UPI00301818C7